MSDDTPTTALAEPPKYTGGLGRCDVPPTFATQMQMATILADSGDMIPKRFQDRPGAIFAAMQHAKTLDITVWTALHSTFVTPDGDHGMYAELMHGLVTRAGHEILIVSETPPSIGKDDDGNLTITGQCTLRLVRWDKPHREDMQASFTLEQARVAGLLTKKNWVHYPDDMLYARALARLVRRFAREYVLGFGYLPDELDRVNSTDPLDRQFVVADQRIADEVAAIVAAATAEGVTHLDIQDLAAQAQKRHVLQQITADGQQLRRFLLDRYDALAPADAPAPDTDQGERDTSTPADDDGGRAASAAITAESLPSAVSVLGLDPKLACGCVKVEVVANGDHRRGCDLRSDAVPVPVPVPVRVTGDGGKRAVVIDAEDPFARHAGVDEVEW